MKNVGKILKSLGFKESSYFTSEMFFMDIMGYEITIGGQVIYAAQYSTRDGEDLRDKGLLYFFTWRQLRTCKVFSATMFSIEFIEDVKSFKKTLMEDLILCGSCTYERSVDGRSIKTFECNGHRTNN